LEKKGGEGATGFLLCFLAPNQEREEEYPRVEGYEANAKKKVENRKTEKEMAADEKGMKGGDSFANGNHLSQKKNVMDGTASLGRWSFRVQLMKPKENDSKMCVREMQRRATHI